MPQLYIFVTVLLVSTFWGHSARAQSPPLNDLAGREQVAPDVVPHYRNSLAAAPAKSGAELSLVVGVVQRPTRQYITAAALLSLPWPNWLSLGLTTDHAGPVRAQVPPRSPHITLVESPSHRRARPAVQLPVLRPRDVRAAVAASRRHASETAALEDLESMVRRARWSSLLPEVRLRATRLVDESASLSPTSYDAQRTTSSGGVSLWLEGRASWKLHRALFAEEELRAAQQRRQLDKARRLLAVHTSQLLLAWLRAVYRARDPLNSPEQCLDAWFGEQQTAAELDVVTAGWHKRWMKRHAPLPQPWCARELFERVEDVERAPAEEAPGNSRAKHQPLQPPRTGPTIAQLSVAERS